MFTMDWLFLLVAAIAMNAIQGMQFRTVWIAGTSANSGQDCNTMCRGSDWFCDGGAWPDTEEEIKEVAAKNGIECDTYCRRPDVDDVPTILEKGGVRQCTIRKPDSMIGQQCLYGKPAEGSSMPARCFRKTPGNIRICPCFGAHKPESVTTTTITTTSTTTTTTSTASKVAIAVTKSIVQHMTTKWIAGTSANVGQDCDTMCRFSGLVCDSNAVWPDTEADMRATAKSNSIRCDNYCYRNDFGQAPVVVPTGGDSQCNNGKTVGQQCVYGKTLTRGVLPRCNRKFGTRIRICPCLSPTTTTTTTTTNMATATTTDISGSPSPAPLPSPSPSPAPTKATADSPKSPTTLPPSTDAMTTTAPPSPSVTSTGTTFGEESTNNEFEGTSSEEHEEPSTTHQVYDGFVDETTEEASTGLSNFFLVTVTLAGAGFGIFFISVLIIIVGCAMRMQLGRDNISVEVPAGTAAQKHFSPRESSATSAATPHQRAEPTVNRSSDRASAPAPRRYPNPPAPSRRPPEPMENRRNDEHAASRGRVLRIDTTSHSQQMRHHSNNRGRPPPQMMHQNPDMPSHYDPRGSRGSPPRPMYPRHHSPGFAPHQHMSAQFEGRPNRRPQW